MEEQGKGLFQKLLRREGWRRAIVAIGIAGMVLILLGSLFPGSQGQSGTPAAGEGSMNSQEYLEKTEARLERLLSGVRRPLVLTELPPRIQGVVVVCEGAGSAPVASRVIDVVTTSLGITSLQVCVVQSANK